MATGKLSISSARPLFPQGKLVWNPNWPGVQSKCVWRFLSIVNGSKSGMTTWSASPVSSLFSPFHFGNFRKIKYGELHHPCRHGWWWLLLTSKSNGQSKKVAIKFFCNQKLYIILSFQNWRKSKYSFSKNFLFKEIPSVHLLFYFIFYFPT